MPLEEFLHWCAFINIEAYESTLTENDEPSSDPQVQRDFFKKNLLGH